MIQIVYYEKKGGGKNSPLHYKGAINRERAAEIIKENRAIKLS
jgi:hypothetical protein